MINIYIAFLAFFWIFGKSLSILSTLLLVSFSIISGLFFFLKAICASLITQVFLSFWRSLDLVFFSLERLLLLDKVCLFDICILSTVGFSLKFGSDVIILEVIFL